MDNKLVTSNATIEACQLFGNGSYSVGTDLMRPPKTNTAVVHIWIERGMMSQSLWNSVAFHTYLGI